jgi:hypothetical protein
MVTAVLTKLKLLLFPRLRRIYLVQDGTYKGEWLVQVSKTVGHTVFFSLPDKQEYVIPDKEVSWAFQNKLIIPVDVLPKSIYNVCIAEYNHEKQSHSPNRRQQRSPSRALGRQKYKDALNELQGNRDRELVHLFKTDKK